MSRHNIEEKTTTLEEVGLLLRSRREALGWKENDVAEHLRIRPSMLAAIENGNFQALPGQAYIIGFLRSYADLLGLNADEVVSAFKQEVAKHHSHVLEKPALSFPQTVEDKSLPKWFLIAVGLAVVIAAYAGWYHFSSHDEAVKKAVNSSLLKIEKPDADFPQKSPIVSSNHGSVGQQSVEKEIIKPQEPLNSVPTNETVASASNNAPVATKLSTDVVSKQSVQNGQTSLQDKPKSPFVDPVPKVEEKHAQPELPTKEIDVQFIHDSWTEIKDNNGKVLESRVFKTGESWHGDNVDMPYKITVGNAGGVVLKAGGVTSNPLGKDGQVKRNIEVSSEKILDGSFGHNDSVSVVKQQSDKKQNSEPSSVKTLDKNSLKH